LAALLAAGCDPHRLPSDAIAGSDHRAGSAAATDLDRSAATPSSHGHRLAHRGVEELGGEMNPREEGRYGRNYERCKVSGARKRKSVALRIPKVVKLPRSTFASPTRGPPERN
jgi:hypothetical protein